MKIHPRNELVSCISQSDIKGNLSIVASKRFMFHFSYLTVPPSQKPPTTSLRIDRFLRPFTLKAVQELLGKTGTVTSFWMDHIKTHCYVTVSPLSCKSLLHKNVTSPETTFGC